MSITLKEALSAIDASIAKAEAISVPVVVSVVDAGGHMIAQAKMDDCIYASISISYYKAQTAIFMKMATHELAEVSQPGKALWGLGESSCGNLILFGGGFLVKRDGQIVGAIGVSGGSVDQDMEIAQVGQGVLQG